MSHWHRSPRAVFVKTLLLRSNFLSSLIVNFRSNRSRTSRKALVREHIPMMKFFVARNVITMGMRVGYDHRNPLAIVPAQPLINLTLYDPSNVGLTRARVKQECFLLSEEQV